MIGVQTRGLVYVAGPFAADTEALIARNVALAVAVGRLAVVRGYAPIVPHAGGWLGVHGARDESVPGVRESALTCADAIVEAVAAFGGAFWAISRSDGTLSAGCMRERAIYVGSYRSRFGDDPPPPLIVRHRWEWWASQIRQARIEVPRAEEILSSWEVRGG